MTRSKKTTQAAALSAAAPAMDEGRDETGRWRRRVANIFISVVAAMIAVQLYALYSTNGLPTASTIFAPPNASSNISMTDVAASLSTGFDEFYATYVQPLRDMALDGVAHAAEEGSRVGHQLRGRSARAKHPVVLIPGFTSSGLELWEGHGCLKRHFRQRLWGSAEMAKSFLADSECWRRHLMLHPRTGMDPENVRVRAAQGFGAADNFVGAYWVWSKIIENLADVGYDGSTMTMMSYDWRLGFEHLESRDGYLTKLKHAIEGHRSATGEKVVVVSHSMGGLLYYYFLQWVVADVKAGGGGGGRDWIETNVQAFVNIAGPMLGVPKAIPAVLSGELGDTAALLPQLGDLLERYFGRRWRRNLWMTWGSLFGMLPKGGDAIWGVGADVRDEEDSSGGDDAEANGAHASTTRPLVPAIVWHNGTDEICPAATPTTEAPTNEDPLGLSALDIHPSRAWSEERAIEYLLRNDRGGSSSIYSFDSKKGWKTRASSVDKRKHWHDPIATKLPSAPSLKIYCLYGVGIQTERSYYYKVSCDKVGGASGGDMDRACPRENEDETQCGNIPDTNDDDPPEAPFFIDTSAKDDSKDIRSGVRFSDGDATVPLLSLGYMCQKWAQPRNPHNPSGINVYTRERRHEALMSLSDPGRAGPMAGEHVDILGNVGVIEDVVRIATGFEVERVNEDIIVSDLKRIVQAVDEHYLGGSSGVSV
ncbi:hypothetical protein ACHAW5_003865 [Stephanodiscus triporus]|uniref:Phospholipid:diacylglycerol acyltransferase n=1 Tax=Stephanodiscus triporus TaxID=2934178 RepID=A0ABD3P3L3_9STRA